MKRPGSKGTTQGVTDPVTSACPGRQGMRPLGVTVATLCIAAMVIGVALAAPGPLARRDIGSASYSRLSPSERSTAINDVRGALLQVIGALAVAVAGIVGWIQYGISRRQFVLSSEQLLATTQANRLQHDLAQQSLISQRLTSSVEQLGSEQAAVRVGAVYGLELIVAISPGQRDVVMEILCAFVRATSGGIPSISPPKARLPMVGWTTSQFDQPVLAVREPDRQAALRVLGRLTIGPFDEEALLDRTDRDVFSMEGAELRRADLTLGRFDGANLRYCDLRGANMSGAFFESANSFWATLAGANLAGSNLCCATFDDADLRETDFTGAQLVGATFARADISGATFERADLRGIDMSAVEGAELASLDEIAIDEESRLPSGSGGG